VAIRLVKFKMIKRIGVRAPVVRHLADPVCGGRRTKPPGPPDRCVKWLIDASNGNIDQLSDLSPIRSLIEQLRRVRVMKYQTKLRGQTDETSGFA
jgi:hypothetical protein